MKIRIHGHNVDNQLADQFTKGLSQIVRKSQAMVQPQSLVESHITIKCTSQSMRWDDFC